MNDELSPEAKELLSLAKSHDELGPTTQDRARVKRALQVAIAAGASATASAAAASTAGGASIVAGSSAVLLKGLAVLTAVGGLVTATVVSVANEDGTVRHAPEQPAARERPAEADLEAPSVQPTHERDEAAEETLPEPIVEDVAPQPAVPAPSRARLRRRPPEVRSPGSPDGEPDEAATEDTPSLDPRRDVVLLREALSHLRRGAHSQARAALNAHAREYPSSALSVEREGLSALLACETQGASQAAEAFLARHPGSALRAQLERACSLP